MQYMFDTEFSAMVALFVCGMLGWALARWTKSHYLMFTSQTGLSKKAEFEAPDDILEDIAEENEEDMAEAESTPADVDLVRQTDVTKNHCLRHRGNQEVSQLPSDRKQGCVEAQLSAHVDFLLKEAMRAEFEMDQGF
eukprot:TRINITY_DN10041_c0_g1_i1.p1 TRINITY_DN10041_c0_g1~~TRINITY_DN10041_c0_g1_i1.p1  ORF type:complete len:137 (-),score=47.77 TRINITY_DN10041_c0_g1_i1:185-595(-)